MRNPIYSDSAPTIIGYILGYGIGFATAVWYIRNSMQDKYAIDLAREVKATKDFYKVLHKQDISPSDYLKEVIDAEEVIIDDDPDKKMLEELAEEYMPPETVVAIERVRTIRTKTASSREVTTEEISAEQLEDPDFSHETKTLTFYREDGVLTHEDGQIIYHPEEVIGLNNFRGLESVSDNQIQVFFRDHKNSIDWIIDMDPGAFETQHFKHAKRPRDRRPKKFRMDE